MKTQLTIALVALLAGGLAVAQDKAVRSDLTPEDLARVAAVTAPTIDFSGPENFEAKPAGAGTTKFAPNADAFSHFLDNLSFEQEEQFKLGNGVGRHV